MKQVQRALGRHMIGPLVPVLSNFCLAPGGMRRYGHDHACFRPRGHDPAAMHQCWCNVVFPGKAAAEPANTPVRT